MIAARALIFGVAFLLTLGTATQWTAHRAAHPDWLGLRLSIGDKHLYPPWGILKWAHVRSRPVAEGRILLVVGVLLTVLAGSQLRQRKVPPVGQKKWGRIREAKAAGLLPEQSPTRIVVGRLQGRLVSFDGPEHQLVVGATRSGKGVGHVIPTLLWGWLESCLVYDIKGELWERTAGFRSKFSHTLFFNPTRTDSARYNPLLEVRKGQHEIRDIQNIVGLLVDEDGSKQQLSVWDQHASQMLVALCLHTLYAEQDKTLGRVRDLLLDFERSFPAIMGTKHRENPGTGDRETHPEVQRVVRDMLEQPPKFQAGVRATAAGYLILFADETVRRNTSASDFRASDLMCASVPVTLYLQPPPSDAQRLRPLMRLMLNQICRSLLEHLDKDSAGRNKLHKLLLELDEFPTLGRMDFMVENFRQMAGFGMKCHVIAQSFSDITSTYGRDNSLIDNFHVISVFACSDTVTQQRVSQMTGTVTEYRQSFSRNRGGFGLRRSTAFSGSVSDAEQVRPLMQPGEVRELPTSTQLVFVTGHTPFKCQKVRYFCDEEFRDNELPAPQQIGHIDVPQSHRTWVSPWVGLKPPVQKEEQAATEPSCQEVCGQEHLFSEATGATVAANDPANAGTDALKSATEENEPLFHHARKDRYGL